MRTQETRNIAEPSSVEPLIVCPQCKVEMRLFGIEAETPIRDLFTFECDKCGSLEVRGVLAR
jgi:predicted  nucleic acid-binding Zn ribbon protein